MRFLLDDAKLYQAFQEKLGFSAVREKTIKEYLSVSPGDRVVDIGCGPGKILTYLPEGVHYQGFDVDSTYIEYAQKTYGDRAEFYCRPFTEDIVSEVGPADFVMLNGVLHHLDDSHADEILKAASACLSSKGRLFTLDGCYTPKQNRFAKKLLDWDRGEHVRDTEAYLDLLKPHFTEVEHFVRENLSLIPYTFLIMVAKR